LNLPNSNDGKESLTTLALQPFKAPPLQDPLLRVPPQIVGRSGFRIISHPI
jgi:hypothetical protein